MILSGLSCCERDFARGVLLRQLRDGPLSDAAANADIVLVMLPDEVIPGVFGAEVAPHLSAGSAIVFGSGYALAYGLIEPPADIDVLLMAPRCAGDNIRQRFLDRQGYFAFVSVEQDADGKAWPRLLALADAVGILRTGAMELSARQEADIDLLIEQTLGAVLGTTIMTTFAVGQEAGLPAEALVMEMYMSGEMETVFEAFREQGFFRSAQGHGPTALFGAYRRTMQFMQSDLAAKFAETMEEIQSGEFARLFQAEQQADYPTLSQAEAMIAADNDISQAESRVRQAMTQGAHGDEEAT